MDSSLQPDGVRRFLLAAGTADYEHLGGAWRLPKVCEDVKHVTKLLEQLGAVAILKEHCNLRTERLRRALASGLRRPADVAVVYYAGHGGVSDKDGRHYLYARDSREDDLFASALAAEELAWMLAYSPARQALVLVDCCYAGHGIDDLVRALLRVVEQRPAIDSDERPTGVWVIAASCRTQEADEGAFVRALQVAVANQDQRLGGPRQQYLAPDGLVEAINRELVRRGIPQRAVQSSLHVTASCRAVRNPHFRPEALVLPEELSWTEQRRVLADLEHWDPKARGVAARSAAGWYFTGRQQALAELSAWLTGPTVPRRLQLVTGGPGSGKSAVLARLVTLSDPAYRAHTPAEALVNGPDLPPGLIHVAVHAHGKTLADVVAELAEVMGVQTDTATGLLAAVRARQGRWVLVIDALDEAVDPPTIITEVLNPLAKDPGQMDARVLVGARSHLRGAFDPDLTAEMDLDAERYFDPADVVEYVSRMLVDTRSGSPYGDDPTAARQTAEAVAGKAGRMFLLARLYADRLAAATEQVDLADPLWQRQPRELGRLLDEYLAGLGPHPTWAKDLLRPLAFAEGAGLPWQTLWAPLASALSHHVYTDDDIVRLFGVAGSYVIESTEQERSVYRLYHEALAEHLRNEAQSIELQRSLVEALIACVPTDVTKQHDWVAAHPYIRTHLATHAAAAGRLDELLDDPQFLLAAVPSRLLRVLSATTTPRAVQAASVYRRAVAQLHGRPIAEGAAYLQLHARQAGRNDLADRVVTPGSQQPWSVRWARWRPLHAGRTVGRHRRAARGVAIGELNGRPMVVSSGEDNTVRAWDLENGTPIGSLLTGTYGPAALAELDGRPLVVSGGSDDLSVRVWDLASGRRFHKLPAQRVVNAVAVSSLGGRPVVVDNGGDSSVRVWDLEHGTAIREVSTGYLMDDLAVGEFDGRPVVATGDYDGTVGVWDLATGDPVGRPLHGHDDWVRAVAVGELHGQTIVVSGSDDRTIRVWDLGRGTQLHKFRGDDGNMLGDVTAVAVGKRQGRPIIVSGDWDGIVRVWDLEHGTAIGEPLRGHDAWVRGGVHAVAVGELHGRPIVVSAGGDGTVRVWDLAEGTAIEEPRRGQNTWAGGGYQAVAVGERHGRQVVVSGGGDKTVEVWDLATGDPVGPPLHGHDDWIEAVVVGELQGRPVIVSGDGRGTVRVWDLELGTPLGEPLAGDGWGAESVAIGKLDGRTVAVIGTFFQEVRVWDLAKGHQLGNPLIGHPRGGDAVAVGELQGRPIIISGSYRGPLQRWDLATGHPLGKPLIGHSERVRAVAVGMLEGLPVIISGDDDGTVRVWDLATGRSVGKPLTGHDDWVTTVAVGELEGRRGPVVVSGSNDGTVRVWELALGVEQVIEVGSAVQAVVLVPRSTDVVVGTRMGLLVLELASASTRMSPLRYKPWR